MNDILRQQWKKTKKHEEICEQHKHNIRWTMKEGFGSKKSNLCGRPDVWRRSLDNFMES